MLKRIADRLVTLYCLLYAIFAVVLPAAYKRYGLDWYMRLGFILGLTLSAIIILWEAVT